MLEDIRKSYGLTRQQLAELTGRSINYVLKAEQATFPSAPVALTDFYARDSYEGAYPLRIEWVPQSRDVMRDAYRNTQRRKREAWLNDWEPVPYTAGLPFRHKWLKRTLDTNYWHTTAGGYGAVQGNQGSQGSGVGSSFSERLRVYPTQYSISSGLCLPAAVIYRNDKDLTKAGAIVTCMEDLVEYILSGKHRAEYLGEERLLLEEDAVLRIAKEEGVKTNGDTRAA